MNHVHEPLWEERPDERGSFGARLESWAKTVVERENSANEGEREIERVVARELELVLWQLDEIRDAHARQLRSLLRVECYVDTELIQMEQRTPRYSPYRFPEREKLQRRLLAIESERRTLSVDRAIHLGRLHDRLLTALNRHAQLAA